MLEKHLRRNAVASEKEITRKRHRMDSISSQVSEASDIGIESNSEKIPIKIPNKPATKKKKFNKDIDFSVLKTLNAKVLTDEKLTDKEVKEESDMQEESIGKKHRPKKVKNANENTDLVAPPGWDDNYNPWAGVVDVKEEKGSEDEEINPHEEHNSDSMKSKKHLSKNEKKELDRLETAEISRLEKQILDGEKTEPITSVEFDR